jgi:hypothetical protein
MAHCKTYFDIYLYSQHLNLDCHNVTLNIRVTRCVWPKNETNDKDIFAFIAFNKSFYHNCNNLSKFRYFTQQVNGYISRFTDPKFDNLYLRI